MLTQLACSVKVLRVVLVATALFAGKSAFAEEGTTALRGGASDLKKMHVLLVIDSESNLKESVAHDRQHMEWILKSFIPGKMRDITVIEGKKVTRQAILDYYHNLRMGSDETLLFYYAGHGRLDDQNRHCFQLQEDTELLRREEVLQAMKDKKAGLVVLLSDCCSVKTRLVSKTSDDSPAPGVDRPLISIQFHPLLRCLFFQHRGVVDITAAQDGTGSWGDDRRGGIFTQALYGLLRNDLKQLDKNKDGFVSWKEFFPQLERKTEETFDRWCEQLRTTEKVDIKKQQRSQKPRTFGPLPEPTLLAKNDPKSEKKAFAVVSLVNKTGKPLSYRYRWNTEDKWNEGKLEKNGKTIHDRMVKAELPENRLPKLEMDIPSEKLHDKLQPRKWIGMGRPTFKDGREIELTHDK